MSGRTKPKRHRQTVSRVNPLAHLFTHASKLRPDELERLFRPKRDALQAARTCTFTESHFNDLCTALNVGEAIEGLGVVRGLQAELAAARQVLEGIGQSMDTPQGWQPHALHWQGLDALATLVRVHRFQCEQLQYNEYQAACRLAEARVATEGGQVIRKQEVPHGR